MRENTYAALEIGDFYTKLVIGFYDGETINILFTKKTYTKGVENGDIVSKGDVIASISELLNEAEKLDLAVDKVILVLPNKSLQVYRMKAELKLANHQVTEADIRQIQNACRNYNRIESRIVVDVKPISYVLDGNDFQRTAPINYAGNTMILDAFVYSVKSTIAVGLRDLLYEIGIEIIDIVIDTIGSANITLTKEELNHGAYLVDIGATGNSVSFFKDTLLNEFREGKFGGNFLTSQLSQGLEVDAKEAEKVKLYYGSCDLEGTSRIAIYQNKTGHRYTEYDIASLLSTSLNTITQDIKKSIEDLDCNETYDSPIILVGGTSNLFGIDKKLRKELNREVIIRRKNTFGARNNVYIPLVGSIAYYIRRSK